MKIYTNDQHEIVAYDISPTNYSYEYDVEESFKGNWCDTCIFGFKYEPQYEHELNADGSTKTDAFGTPICKLNENGEKIYQGISFYPFVDMNTLYRIQTEHDEQEIQTEELTASVVDNDYRLSVVELGL